MRRRIRLARIFPPGKRKEPGLYERATGGIAWKQEPPDFWIDPSKAKAQPSYCERCFPLANYPNGPPDPGTAPPVVFHQGRWICAGCARILGVETTSETESAEQPPSGTITITGLDENGESVTEEIPSSCRFCEGPPVVRTERGWVCAVCHHATDLPILEEAPTPEPLTFFPPPTPISTLAPAECRFCDQPPIARTNRGWLCEACLYTAPGNLPESPEDDPVISCTEGTSIRPVAPELCQACEMHPPVILTPVGWFCFDCNSQYQMGQGTPVPAQRAPANCQRCQLAPPVTRTRRGYLCYDCYQIIQSQDEV